MATRKIRKPHSLPLNSAPVWAVGMNDEQLSAITHGDGPCVVLAQAGSGKTRALVHRLVKLVEDGTPAEKILAVTFSKKAADEMTERAHLLGIQARIGTWHSLCLEIIKTDKLPQASWIIDDQDKAKYIAKECLGFKGVNWDGADCNEFRSFIAWCKAYLIEAETNEALEEANNWFGREGRLAYNAYSLYERTIAAKQLLTFDDYLVVVYRYLKGNEEAHKTWAAKWLYLLQDEAQDANLAQCAIADLLTSEHKNYMIVGDPAQSIYGFRGSSPDYIMEFQKTYNSKIVVMNKNYRSTNSIIEVANNVIRKAEIRLETDMVCMRKEEGSVIAVFAEDLDDEANKFSTWVEERVASGEKYSDTTCLFRTNAQSRAIEESLLKKRIPYVVVGGSSFYERKEVKDLLAYLRIVCKQDTAGENIRRCINAPFRYLGQKFVERVMIESKSSSEPDWLQIINNVCSQQGIQSRQRSSAIEWCNIMSYLQNVIENPPKDNNPLNPSKPEQILEYIVQATDYMGWLKKEEGSESLHNNPQSNVRELIRVSNRFDTVKELLAYIDRNIAEAAKQRKDTQAGGNRVLLMSVHRSKGLEWPNVWVVGCNEGILPHAKGDPEEERRLAYVAFTRARNHLRTSYVKSVAIGAAIKEIPVSRYLLDCELVTADTNFIEPIY